MATLYTAASDKRITVAVPSCSFSTIASPMGRIYHCDCNLVPGIFEWGDLYDVAGLAAPRHLLSVNGRQDKLHEASSIERPQPSTATRLSIQPHPIRDVSVLPHAASSRLTVSIRRFGGKGLCR